MTPTTLELSPEEEHAKHLALWMHGGQTEHYEACLRLIEQGIQCATRWTRDAAAVYFVTAGVDDSLLPLQHHLLQRYVAAGQIRLGDKITVKAGGWEYEQHGWLPLLAAVRNRILPMACFMVEAGALEVADYGKVLLAWQGLELTPDENLLRFCAAQWPMDEQVLAQVRAALLNRHIARGQSVGESMPDPAKSAHLSAPRRARAL